MMEETEVKKLNPVDLHDVHARQNREVMDRLDRLARIGFSYQFIESIHDEPIVVCPTGEQMTLGMVEQRYLGSAR